MQDENETPSETAPRRRGGQAVWISIDQYNRLGVQAEKAGKSRSALVRRAVELMLRRMEKPSAELEVR
jgi:predicted DNA-binding protein